MEQIKDDPASTRYYSDSFILPESIAGQLLHVPTRRGQQWLQRLELPLDEAYPE